MGKKWERIKSIAKDVNDLYAKHKEEHFQDQLSTPEVKQGLTETYNVDVQSIGEDKETLKAAFATCKIFGELHKRKGGYEKTRNTAIMKNALEIAGK